MVTGRLRDHTPLKAQRKLTAWRYASLALIHKRRQREPSCATRMSTILMWAAQTEKRRNERRRYAIRSWHISTTNFLTSFTMLSDNACLSLFRFRRQDVHRILPFFKWPPHQSYTSRSRYSVTPPLAACVVVRGLATPCRWKDVELLFGRHASQLSEIFWEGLRFFVSHNSDLLMANCEPSSWRPRLEMYADAVAEKSNALNNTVGFIDGTVISIVRPGGEGIVQRVAYNGHKRKHGIKYQAVTTPCGLAMHLHGPMEVRRHDWTLFLQSGVEEFMEEMLKVGDKQHALYGDSGYSMRVYLDTPFAGSYLSDIQNALKKAMARSRVTVEWFFKDVKQYWTYVDFKRKLRTREHAVCAIYIAAALLTNMRNCIYQNTISQYFGCRPPTLEEYMYHRE